MENDCVNIIIVTYNNLECLCQVVGDISSHSTYPYKLIVVDNNSSDQNVLSYLNDISGQETIDIVRMPSNTYYFPAVNAGLSHMDKNNRYTLILNDDVLVESDTWLQQMIRLLESDDRIAYVGDFMRRPACPPFGGWIDGWCMLFRTEIFEKVGLFSSRYVWWYGPADFAVRVYKQGYIIKDLKKKGDENHHIKGVVRHLGGQTFDRVKKEQELPLEIMFPADFKFRKLLLENGLHWRYLQALLQYSIVIAKRGVKRMLSIQFYPLVHG